MSSKRATVETDDTDYSSDTDHFIAHLLRDSKKSCQSRGCKHSCTKEINDSPEDNIIKSASILELESITLKQLLEETKTLLKEFPKEDVSSFATKIQNLETRLDNVTTTISDSFYCNDTKGENEKKYAAVMEEIEKVKNNTMVLSKSTTLASEELVKTLKTVKATQSSIRSINAKQKNTQNMINDQRNLYNQLIIKQDCLEKSISDVQLFLQLMLPRLIKVENVVFNLQTGDIQGEGSQDGGNYSKIKKKRKLD